MVAHYLFWSCPVPGSGTEEDGRASAALAERARALLERVEAVNVERNRSVVDLLAYELDRAAWVFDSVVFNANPSTEHAGRLAGQLRELKERFGELWKRTNIIEGLDELYERFDKLTELYEDESRELTEWDGVWGPIKRIQTAPHPM